MTTEELLNLVRSIADEDKADPICDEFVVLTIDEVMKLCNAVAAKEHQ